MKKQRVSTINIYTCQDGHKTVTKDIDTGTTSFIITCKCGKNATSCFYNCNQDLKYTHVWHKPFKITKEIAEHVRLGGLVISTIKEYNNKCKFQAKKDEKSRKKTRMPMQTNIVVDDDTLMWFGKHRGTRLEDVPAAYLLYLYDSPDIVVSEQLNEYIEDVIEILRKEAGEL